MNKGSKHYNNTAEKQLNIQKGFKHWGLKNRYLKNVCLTRRAYHHSLSNATNTQRHSLTQTSAVKHEVVISTHYFLLIICHQRND